MIEKGRYIGVSQEQRYCSYCKDVVENEFHFLFKCSLYTDIRKKYLPEEYTVNSTLNPEKYTVNPTLNKFNSRNVNTVRNVAMFIYYAFEARRNSLD